jgi:hypothetical protein
MDIIAGLSAFSTLISAIATVFIAILTAITIKAYNKQVQIGLEQVKATQEQTFNQARPILYPPTDMSGLVEMDQGSKIIRWGGGSQRIIEGLQNIGTGPAFNIYGLFFGRMSRNTPPHERYAAWNYGVLPHNVTGDKITLSQGTNLKSETILEGHPLYVPDDEQHIGRIARLTLTYHDIFGRKFASIYDYQSILGWICVGHFQDIEQDLRELDDQDPTTKQSNSFYHQLGKMKL